MGVVCAPRPAWLPFVGDTRCWGESRVKIQFFWENELHFEWLQDQSFLWHVPRRVVIERLLLSFVRQVPTPRRRISGARIFAKRTGYRVEFVR